MKNESYITYINKHPSHEKQVTSGKEVENAEVFPAHLPSPEEVFGVDGGFYYTLKTEYEHLVQRKSAFEPTEQKLLFVEYVELVQRVRTLQKDIEILKKSELEVLHQEKLVEERHIKEGALKWDMQALEDIYEKHLALTEKKDAHKDEEDKPAVESIEKPLRNVA